MRTPLAVAIALVSLVPSATHAQESAWLVKLGADTLSLEKFTRTATQVRGELVTRTPRSLHRTYVMDLNPDGTVRRFELVTRELRPTPGPGETRGTIDFLGDSATVVVPRGDSSVTYRVASGPGSVPSLNGVMGIMDQIGRQYRSGKLGTSTFGMIALSPTGLRGSIAPGGGDTLHLNVTTPVGAIPPFTIRTDPAGQLLEFSGHGSVFQADGVRVASVDLAAAAKAYSERPIGQLSTRDTVRAMIGDSEVWIDYGRPLRRGRKIFGEVVAWNTVWRTGANAATQLRASKDLVIGGAPVPAGIYSLWTLPTPTGWKLIINKQSGQWGTVYDPAQDLVRVDMTVAPSPRPGERFTIDIDPKNRMETLWMTWDQTRVSVPMKTP